MRAETHSMGWLAGEIPAAQQLPRVSACIESIFDENSLSPPFCLAVAAAAAARQTVQFTFTIALHSF